MKENHVYLLREKTIIIDFINIEPNNRNLGVFKHVKLNEEYKFGCGHSSLCLHTLQ